MAHPMTDAALRAEFEAWASNDVCPFEDFSRYGFGEYISPATLNAWIGWQAGYRAGAARVVPDTVSDADALEQIGRAVREHQRNGGGAGHLWDLAIFRAGQRSARVVGIPRERVVWLDAVEACARRVELIGRDWQDSGAQQKWFAVEYLVADLRGNPPTDAAREQPQQQNAETYTSGGNPSRPTDSERA